MFPCFLDFLLEVGFFRFELLLQVVVRFVDLKQAHSGFFGCFFFFRLFNVVGGAFVTVSVLEFVINDVHKSLRWGQHTGDKTRERPLLLVDTLENRDILRLDVPFCLSVAALVARSSTAFESSVGGLSGKLSRYLASRFVSALEAHGFSSSSEFSCSF